MYNIYFDLAAVFICIAVLVSLVIRKLTSGRNNRIFLLLIVMVGTAGILDVITNLYGPVFPENRYTIFSQYLFNFLYFIVRNATTPVYIIYASSLLGIWHRYRESALLRMALVAPFGVDVLLLIINFFTPIIFGFNGHGEYYRGYLIQILYGVAMYYMVFGLVLVVKNVNAISRHKMLSIVVFLPLTALAVGIQMVFPAWRIEIIATALMSLIIAIGVQRPEENLDEVVNALSFNNFITDAEKFFITKRPLSILYVNISNYVDIRSNIDVETNAILLRKVSNMLHRICRVIGVMPDIYYLDQGRFAIVTDYHLREGLVDAGRLACSYLRDSIKVGEMEIGLDCMVVIADAPKDLVSEREVVNFSQSMVDYLPDSDALIYLSEHIGTKEYRLRSKLDDIISRAVAYSNFKMYYQPIYSVHDKKFISSEALIRLIDSKYGFVSPGLFIPAAEKSGAIHKVGEFVFDDVCRFISQNDLSQYGVEYVEINLSIAQCIDLKLAEHINEIFAKYNVSPSKVNLEITETAMDSDSVITNKNIQKLSKAGYSFSLDDYGTGYSNISRVATLPVEIVKIDKSIVDVIDRPDMQVIISNTINMFKKMNKKVLVEGVEDKATLDTCINMGCDYIQGFYFSKPLPEEDYLEFIKRENLKEA